MQRIERAPDPGLTGLSMHERDALAQLILERDTLIERLEHGSRQIEEMRLAGHDVTRWEDFWIKLLREYERLTDRIDAYASELILPKAG